MSAHPFRIEGVVLRSVPYGESDVVITLFARGRGKLGAFARGGRKSVRRFAGALEPFALVAAEVGERRGADLLDLRSAAVLEPHLGLRDDLFRLAHAGYAVEVVRELVRDRQPNDRLLDQLLAILSLLARGEARSLRLRAFELAVLGAAGFAPRLDACVACGATPPEDYFDVRLGGTTCAPCADRSTLRIDAATRALLLALQQGGVAAAEAASDEGLPLEPVRRVLRAFTDHHVRRDLRSLSFLHEVGAPP